MMRPGRLCVAIAFLVAGCNHGEPARESVPDRIAPQTSPNAEPSSDLTFPGGGLILFQSADGPAYERRGFGVVTSKGRVVLRSMQNVLPYWDPARNRRVITVSYNGRRAVRSYWLREGAFVSGGRWPTQSENFVSFSLDGRYIADIPFRRDGRMITGEARIIDRGSGAVRHIHLGGDLVVEAWTPDGRLLALPWSGGGDAVVDPVTLTRESFESMDPVWAPDGRTFAVNIARRGGRDLGIGIGRDGELRSRTWVSGGHRFVETPTWSPDGRRVAVIVRGGGTHGERTADLVVIEATTGVTSVIARRVSDAWWVSWSPDGEWMLVDDWTRDRWLFVSADGKKKIAYPWLGASPRWCCPSSPPINVRIPVS
jgi:hypothetical protein